jgi:hypothetical protein
MKGRSGLRRGGKFGRKLSRGQSEDAGEALAEIGRSYNVSHSTISRLRDWLPGNSIAEAEQ